jgi:hypothetical protein
MGQRPVRIVLVRRQLRERAGRFGQAVDLDEIAAQCRDRFGQGHRADRRTGIEHPAQLELSRTCLGGDTDGSQHRRNEEGNADFF